MDSFGKSVVDYYNYIIHEKADPRMAHLPLISSPVPILFVIAFYYNFVKYSGPKFMENRKPFDLKKQMIIYNTGQCIVNVWATYQGFRILFNPTFVISCLPPSYATDPFSMKTSFLSYIYFWVKVIDLMDTVFMVLRKNNRQITFLHVYHHIGMAMGCWVIVKYIPGAHLCIVGILNCFVHSVMYFYYLLTAYDSSFKKSLWWKKHLTELQMVQFFLIMVHHAVALFNPNCGYPKIPLLIFLSQNVVIFYLFTDFYRKAYLKPQKKVDK